MSGHAERQFEPSVGETTGVLRSDMVAGWDWWWRAALVCDSDAGRVRAPAV